MPKFMFDDLAHVAAHRAELKALRNEGTISPVEYARLMHDCDVAQSELTVEAANNPTVRAPEARVARSTFTVVPGGKPTVADGWHHNLPVRRFSDPE